jgi:hypothetical protein
VSTHSSIPNFSFQVYHNIFIDSCYVSSDNVIFHTENVSNAGCQNLDSVNQRSLCGGGRGSRELSSHMLAWRLLPGDNFGRRALQNKEKRISYSALGNKLNVISTKQIVQSQLVSAYCQSPFAWWNNSERGPSEPRLVKLSSSGEQNPGRFDNLKMKIISLFKREK